MTRDNPGWGEERIANELLLKLGIQISPRTVRKYLPKLPRGCTRGDQRWSTFMVNHTRKIVACDFLTVVTATFKYFYVLARSHVFMCEIWMHSVAYWLFVRVNSVRRGWSLLDHGSVRPWLITCNSS